MFTRKLIVALCLIAVALCGCKREQQQPVTKQNGQEQVVSDDTQKTSSSPSEEIKPVKPEPVIPAITNVKFEPVDVSKIPEKKPVSLARKPIAGKLKLAFIYIGPVGDAGWSWTHDQGRKKLLEECGDIIESADYEEMVPDGDKALPVIEKYAKAGYHLIFTTSFGHMDPTLEIAKKYPEIVFMHCSGHKLAENMGNYFGRIHQADYLTGLILGKMTTNNKIGYVAPHPIPEVIRGINALTVGARQSNPEAKVYVRWVHSWYDPEKERTYAEDLLNNEGVDVMAQGSDSPTALLCAQEVGFPGTGYNCDMSRFAPEAHLASSVWDWSKIYVPIIKAVKDGTWKSEEIWWGIEKGVVDISPISNRVPEEVKNLVKQQRNAIIAGKFHVFSGPIKNQKGEPLVKQGNKLSDHDMLTMNYFVEGVVGTIPEASGVAGVEKKTRQLKEITAGFVYISNVGDAGWTMAHDESRQALARLPYVKGTHYIENVPEDKEKSTAAIKQMIDKGCNLIFTTSWGFMDPTLEMAQKYPELVFMHCSGYKTNANMGTYFGRMYQARYLSGIIAGKMTKTNKIGYLTPFPIPECIRGLNAFALGVREVNPKAEIHASWTETWYDPNKEREVATLLVDRGVDVLAQHQDSPAAVLVAEENGIMAVGYDSDMTAIAPDAHLTSPIWHWEKICNDIAQRLYEGTWQNEQLWWGLEKGAVGLAPVNPKVPEDVKQLVAKRTQEIIDGKFIVFAGPVRDQDGMLKLAPGKTFTDQELLSMMFFVEGVVGTIPKK